MWFWLSWSAICLQSGYSLKTSQSLSPQHFCSVPCKEPLLRAPVCRNLLLTREHAASSEGWTIVTETRLRSRMCQHLPREPCALRMCLQSIRGSEEKHNGNLSRLLIQLSASWERGWAPAMENSISAYWKTLHLPQVPVPPFLFGRQGNILQQPLENLSLFLK